MKSKDKYHKSTFDKISAERKEKIFTVAISEFARKGYIGANINEIAKNAGISIGSLYSYFASKEDLFLSIIDIGYSLIREVFERVDRSENIFIVMEKLLKDTREYALKYPELNQIYVDLTTQSISKFSELISFKCEEATSKVYEELIEKSRARGEITSKVDNKIIAFYLDNIVITYQFSLSSSYYKNRLKIYLKEIYEDDEKLRREILMIIKSSLQ